MKAPPIYMAPRKSSFPASCRSSKVHPITVEKWHPQERIKVVTERGIFRQMVPTNTHLRRSPHGMRKEDLGVGRHSNGKKGRKSPICPKFLSRLFFGRPQNYSSSPQLPPNRSKEFSFRWWWSPFAFLGLDSAPLSPSSAKPLLKPMPLPPPTPSPISCVMVMVISEIACPSSLLPPSFGGHREEGGKERRTIFGEGNEGEVENGFGM